MTRRAIITAFFIVILTLPCIVLGADQERTISEDMRIITSGSGRYLVKVYAAHGTEESPSDASGSGQLVRGTDGVARILTNHHVVGPTATEVWVHFDDEPFAQKVKVLGRDPLVDLALLEAPRPLVPRAHPIPIARTPINIGDRAYALGYPEQNRTLSFGVITSLSSPHKLAGIDVFFTHQAPIAPGSSGGALIRLMPLHGEELVGINTAVAVAGGGKVRVIGNLGFSIRAEIIARVLPRLEREQVIDHAFMGMEVLDLRLMNPFLYERHTGGRYPPQRPGVIVSRVYPNSPSARAGILPGDIVRRAEVLLDGQWVPVPIGDAVRFAENVFFDLLPGMRMRFDTERGSQAIGREMQLVRFELQQEQEEVPSKPIP